MWFPAVPRASRKSPKHPPADTAQSLEALAAAKRLFLAGKRVDMQKVASSLGVDRVTLYRWVGSREQLLAEVLWYLVDKTIAGQQAAVATSGPTAAAVVTGTTRLVIRHKGMQAFIDREGPLALRLLTTKASAFQRRLIARIAGLIDADRRAGHLHSAVPARDLPFVVVRIMESYIYLNLITGDAPDVARATSVINALLPTR